MSMNNYWVSATSSMKHVLRASATFALFMLGTEHASAQNLIQNPGFEVNPPSSFGNNVGHSISPWVIGAGQQPNVVRVDGAGGSSLSGGTFGPEFDAQNGGTGAGAG